MKPVTDPSLIAQLEGTPEGPGKLVTDPALLEQLESADSGSAAHSMDYREFAQRIKAKYPDYADMDDLDLARRIVAKFPDDYGDITFEDQSPEQRSRWSEVGDVALEAGRRLVSAPAKLARTMTTPEGLASVYRKVNPAIPIAGGLAFGPVGAAGGEFVRQLGAAAVDPSQVPATPLGRFGSVALQGASFVNPSKVLAEVPGARTAAAWVGRNVVSPVAQKVGNVGTAAARRALGFTKRFLNKPGNLGRANEVADAALEEGIVRNPIFHPFSSGTEAMLARTERLGESAGRQMGVTRQVLDANGVAGPNAGESAAKVVQQLSPRFADESRIAEEIAQDMKALGDGRLTYDDAFAVLQELKRKAKYAPMGGPSDQLKANMYRQAYGIFRKELDQAVERGAMMLGDVQGKMFNSYRKAKRLFGITSDAERALTNKISSEAGNNRIGLREAMVAGAELAAGHPGRAAAAIGAIEGVKRFGNATLATTARAVAKGVESAPRLFAKPAALPIVGQAIGQGVNAVSAAPVAPAAPLVPAMLLTEQKAREYLKKARGDKDLARRLATADGWVY